MAGSGKLRRSETEPLEGPEWAVDLFRLTMDKKIGLIVDKKTEGCGECLRSLR